MRWPWQKRRRLVKAPPPQPYIVDRCWGWTPVGEKWDCAEHPCRHWHIADDYYPTSYEAYWRQHWIERHREAPTSHPLTAPGTIPSPW